MAESQWEIVGFTVLVAGLATLAIFPLGVALTWLLACRSWPGKSIIETLVALPLVMPPVAMGLILLKLLGRKGSIGGFFHCHFDMESVFTLRAAVVAMAVMSLPLLVRGLASPLKPSAPVSNRWLGHWEHRHSGSSLTITFPLGIRGIVAGGVLVFAKALRRIRCNHPRGGQYP